MSHIIVQEGDTLGHLCSRLGVGRRELLQANLSQIQPMWTQEGVLTAELFVGQRLRVPSRDEALVAFTAYDGDFQAYIDCFSKGGMIESGDWGCQKPVDVGDHVNMMDFDQDDVWLALGPDGSKLVRGYYPSARACFEAGGVLTGASPPYTCYRHQRKEVNGAMVDGFDEQDAIDLGSPVWKEGPATFGSRSGAGSTTNASPGPVFDKPSSPLGGLSIDKGDLGKLLQVNPSGSSKQEEASASGGSGSGSSSGWVWGLLLLGGAAAGGWLFLRKKD